MRGKSCEWLLVRLCRQNNPWMKSRFVKKRKKKSHSWFLIVLALRKKTSIKWDFYVHRGLHSSQNQRSFPVPRLSHLKYLKTINMVDFCIYYIYQINYILDPWILVIQQKLIEIPTVVSNSLPFLTIRDNHDHFQRSRQAISKTR